MMNQITHLCIESKPNEGGTLLTWQLGSIPVTKICLSEGARYDLTVTATLTNLVLVIGDEVVEPSRIHQSADSTTYLWRFSPDFYAGEVEIELLNRDCSVFCERADVSPDPKKLGQAFYREILEDLEARVASCLYGGKAGALRIKHSGEQHPPMAFMAMLVGKIDSIERAFANIASAPHRTLISDRSEVKLHQVRRIDAVTILSTTHRPTLVASMRGIEGSSRRETINVPRRQHSFDTASNRIVLGYIDSIVRRCQMLRKALSSECDPGDTDVLESGKKQRWSSKLATLEARIAKLSTETFLDGLKPRSESSGAYIAIARHPAYNRFCRIARQILNPVTKLAVDSEQLLTLKSTYQLYEYWTFFVVLDEVQKQFPQLNWTNHFGLKKHELFHTLASGSAATGNDVNVSIKVEFQRNFGNQTVPYAVSSPCRPDVVVEFIRQGWSRPKFIVLDAKYRSMPTSIQKGINDMHVYRDSIRYSLNEPAIASAFILTPRKLQLPIFDSAFQSKHGIGAIQVSPGDVSGLAAILQSSLHDANV